MVQATMLFTAFSCLAGLSTASISRRDSNDTTAANTAQSVIGSYPASWIASFAAANGTGKLNTSSADLGGTVTSGSNETYPWTSPTWDNATVLDWVISGNAPNSSALPATAATLKIKRSLDGMIMHYFQVPK